MTKLANGVSKLYIKKCVSKLLLVKVSCSMGANNTITTASSSSSGAPRRPTSFLNSKYLFHLVYSASGSGVSVGDVSEQCNFCPHMCCSTMLDCMCTQCTGARRVHIMSFSALYMTLYGLWYSMISFVSFFVLC